MTDSQLYLTIGLPIKVDRMASAWLVRRFIDPQASFRFGDPDN